ncbi:MAG: barstar family protein, partial [Desulfovibrionales bacterium]|nr:barstar family protein [Desulfovibrionales bacterium]
KLRSDDKIKRFATRLRGSRMTNFKSLSDELSSSLHFPYYYSSNWASLDECLGDLEWLFSEEIFLFFEELDSILFDQDERIPTFIDTLESAIQEHGRNKKGYQKLRIILQKNDSHFILFQNEFSKGNLDFTPFLYDFGSNSNIKCDKNLIP